MAACCGVFLGTGMAVAQTGDAMTAREGELLQDARDYDDRCRGGSGDQVETWQACGARDYVAYLLGTLGWCYGEPDQQAYEMDWHRCGARSHVAAKP